MWKDAYGRVARMAAARRAPLASGAAGLSLHRSSLYILPTREGLYYAAMLVVMLLAAVNYANGLAYALTFLLAAIAVVGILHTYQNIARLRISGGPAPPVFAGEPARFTLVAHNDTRVARYAVDIGVGAHARRIDVPSQGTAAIELTVPTVHRGYLRAPPVRLSTRFPLGLWRAWSRLVAVPARCLVYPNPAPEEPLPETPGRQTGRERSRNAEGEDFAGLREFRHGDPVQRVAWKKVASGRGWHTKQFAAPVGQVCWLDWHALAGRGDEERLSLLCRWVLMAEQQEIAYGLRLPGCTIEPGTGALHRDHCLEQLAVFDSK